VPHIHTQYWSLEVPDDWTIDQDEETGAISVSDPDEVGCLDLLVVESESSIEGKADVLDDEFNAFIQDSVLQEELSALPELIDVGFNQFAGKALAYELDGLAWREWYLKGPHYILMVTYNCDQENRDMDASLVDQILETLVQEPGI